MTETDRAVDPDAAGLFAFKVWTYKQGEVVSLMIHLGDRLGIYLAMVDAGPLTAADVARRTGLHERWLLEWLRSQGAAGLLETTDGEHFELTPEGAAVLADEEGSLFFAAGSFRGMVAPPDVVDRLADAFRTGIGLSYDDLGPGGAHAVERARAAAAAEGLDNLTFRVASAQDLPAEPTFDLVWTLDCLHDMTDPAGAAAAIHRALRPDGTWVVKEIKAGATWEENQRNPMLALMYGTSIATCLSSAMAEPGGAGLGTLGLDAVRLEAMCRDAGFTRFATHDVGDPVNLYFEVRH